MTDIIDELHEIVRGPRWHASYQTKEKIAEAITEILHLRKTISLMQTPPQGMMIGLALVMGDGAGRVDGDL